MKPVVSPLRTRVTRLARRVPVYARSVSDLERAARDGSVASIEALLAGGASIDVANAQGQTALHIAARCSRAEAAACLLARGARHDLRDARGRTPLSPANVDPETLHAIRQIDRRTPRQPDDPRAQAFGPPRDPWLAQLRRDGIVKIPGLVPEAQLAAMRGEFEGFVAALDAQRVHGGGEKRAYDEEEHFWADDLAYVGNNAFKHSPALTRFFCDPRLTALATSYYGRRAFITRGTAMRYLPLEERRHDMFGWHHDLEDRRLKALVLLTDLPSSGQVMSYVKRTHRFRHSHRMFYRNGVEADYCARVLGESEVFDTVGRAGDVFFFDSNGIHRGNRRPDAPVRDTFFVEYGIETSNIWGGDPQPDVIAEAVAPEDDPFRELLAAERKWSKPMTRKHPSWIENLYAIDAWRCPDASRVGADRAGATGAGQRL